MRRHFLTKYLWVVLVMGLTPVQLVQAVSWAGLVTADVVDDDVEIDGDVLLGDAANDNVSITAATVDIAINVNTTDRTITANDDLAGGGEKALNLIAAAGLTINLNLDNSLAFVADNENFVVSFSGAGNLRVNLADDTIFELRGDADNGTGTYFLVNMDTVTNTPNPQDVTFVRQSSTSAANVEVLIGVNSLMGFMGTDTTLATQSAIISFDPSNTDATGRVILRVGDGGAMAVQGYLTADTTEPLASDIDFTVQAGAIGALEIQRAVALNFFASLLVISENTVLPDFRSNPWCNDEDLDVNNELIVGIQPGFVLGKNGVLNVAANTYFDYIGAASNVSPTPTIPLAVLDKFTVNGVVPEVNTLVKDRNPSAFMVDGPASQCSALPRPVINMFPPAKIYLRSAVDGDGVTVNPDFTVNPTRQLIETQGNGSIVFDLEGTLDVFGDPLIGGINNTAINVLSLFEADTGGSVLIEGSEVLFKLRPDPWATVVVDNATYPAQYGKACMMFNGRINLNDTTLQHTDEIHAVFEKNILQQSEPTYIGGESFKLCEDRERPHIIYYNSDLLIHSSAAFTGVDQATPSLGLADAGTDNFSDFVFYYNGYAIDNGTGRSLILGTNVGALASDLGTIVDRDAHFDMFQEFEQDETDIVATILARPNNNKVQEGAPASQVDILNQLSVHSFFLGHGTNVSIGTNATMGQDPCAEPQFVLTSHPTLFVNGDFISFETQGGILNDPATSVVTGQGGIFVDSQGLFELANNRRASFATMIATGFNGAVDIRGRNGFFDNAIGVTRSNLDLNDPAQQTIVPADSDIPDFTLNWKYTTRNAAFVPYAQPSTPAVCQCPVPVEANITGLPIINGTVDQFQIRNSRLGDPAHILVDDGKIRELVFSTSNDSGAAPVAVIVMTNDSEVGLGSGHRNNDSPQANAVLGLNGISLMPDGNCQVFLNEDAFITNVCHFLAGPNFGAEGPQKMIITSEVPREIRVREGGAFDVSGFNTADKILEVGGQVTIVFEPGSRLLTGGGELILTDDASIRFEPYVDEDYPTGTDLTSTDAFRVKVSGSGTLRVEENAFVDIPRGAFVGIESGGIETVIDPIGIDQSTITLVDCPFVTNLTWIFEDAAKLYIGGRSDYGGSLQVGNVTDLSDDGGAVTFNLVLNGIGAEVDINSQGFLGMGVGVVDKKDVPANSWIVAPTFNTVATSVTITEGIFTHQQIYTGTDINAGLLAYGAATTGHSFLPNLVAPTQARILGGGNMVLTTAQGAPTVLAVNSDTVGILSSRPTLDDPNNAVPVQPATAAAIFAYLKANPFAVQATPTAQLFESSLGTVTAAYINDTAIVRTDIVSVVGQDGGATDPTRSLQIGTGGVSLSTLGDATISTIRP